MPHLSRSEILRYSRQINLKEIGLEGQQKLKLAKILCVGVGGLGCPALLYLAAAGVGTLGIIDDDFIDISNLQRQILYSEADIGLPKVAVANRELLALNSNLEVEIYQKKLTFENAAEIIQDYDLVIDCCDNFVTRYVINDICHQLKKAFIYASIFQFEGQCAVFKPQESPCYRCLYSEPPPANLMPNCNEAGVLGVLPGLLGTIQATEAIKYILNTSDTLKNKLLTVDLLKLRFNLLNISKDSNCHLCGYGYTIDNLPRYASKVCTMTEKEIPEISCQELLQLKQKHEVIEIIDVREPHEYEICNLQGKLIPLGELQQRINEIPKEKKIVVHCKLGGRGAKAVKLLQAAGFTNVYNLKGGIFAWIDAIDTSLMKY